VRAGHSIHPGDRVRTNLGFGLKCYQTGYWMAATQRVQNQQRNKDLTQDGDNEKHSTTIESPVLDTYPEKNSLLSSIFQEIFKWERCKVSGRAHKGQDKPDARILDMHNR